MWDVDLFNFNFMFILGTSCILSSGVEYRDVYKMCGRLYLPIFLFGVGLLTVIYIASFIALAMLYPSLPMIWKFSTVIMWPVVFLCSNIDEGAFKCSLYLSPKVLDGSPIYSSSHSSCHTSPSI